MLTRRLRLPYTAGLVAAGIGIAFLPFSLTVDLTRDLIFTGLLPPLIFEAAFQLDWKQLRKDLPVITLLATVGVLLSAAITAAGVRYLQNWDWTSAVAFGVLIAATDPSLRGRHIQGSARARTPAGAHRVRESADEVLPP